MNIPAETTIFNYSDIIFSFIVNGETICTHQAASHLLIYVYSGQMTIKEQDKQIVAGAGECVFVRRDHNVTIEKGGCGEKQYQGITMRFTRSFLREYFRLMPNKDMPANTSRFEHSVIKLPKSPDMDSIFYSMTPYFNTEVKPNNDLMQLKLREGIISLLTFDARFYPTLFDFAGKWKIDILDFLNANYMCDLSIEEIASYTGRSLATFKRDFSRISHLPPQKWIMKKRLEVAYGKIMTHSKKVADVCFEVGFKNRSHFTTAFKKQYGVAPTDI